MEDRGFSPDEAKASEEPKQPRKGESFITNWLMKKETNAEAGKSAAPESITNQQESEEITIEHHDQTETAPQELNERELKMKDDIQMLREKAAWEEYLEEDLENKTTALDDQKEVVMEQQSAFEQKLEHQHTQEEAPLEGELERRHEIKDEPAAYQYASGASSVGSILQTKTIPAPAESTQSTRRTISISSLLSDGFQTVVAVISIPRHRLFIYRGFLAGLASLLLYILIKVIF